MRKHWEPVMNLPLCDSFAKQGNEGTRPSGRSRDAQECLEDPVVKQDRLRMSQSKCRIVGTLFITILILQHWLGPFQQRTQTGLSVVAKIGMGQERSVPWRLPDSCLGRTSHDGWRVTISCALHLKVSSVVTAGTHCGILPILVPEDLSRVA
jgi:hypothetical protein